MSAPACSDCGAEMEIGYLADRGDSPGIFPAEWVQGAPVYTRFAGLTTRGRAILRVTTWRCTRCGLLKSYAGGVPGGQR